MTEYASLEAAEAAGAKGSDRIREECGNCEGGNKPWFAHVLNGVCFQCGGAGSHTVLVSSARARERRHRARLAEAAQREAETQAKIAERAQWDAEHPEFVAALESLVAAKISFAMDIAETLQGIPTEGQVAAILRVHAERAAESAAEVDVPEGRGTVTGKVVSVKEMPDNFSRYGGYITKILVEDARGFRVYGTCPNSLLDARSIDELKGTEVTFTATLEGKEKGFGFFKRPSKASFTN